MSSMTDRKNSQISNIFVSLELLTRFFSNQFHFLQIDLLYKVTIFG